MNFHQETFIFRNRNGKFIYISTIKNKLIIYSKKSEYIIMVNLKSNENAIQELIQECNSYQSGMSSHWKKMLDGFEIKNGNFSGKGLPEGEGGIDRTFIQTILHYILQTPFRIKGNNFHEFKKLLKTAKKIHSLRNNKMRLGTLRQVIALAFLEKQITISKITEPIVIIGDGYGLMASLILSHFKDLAQKVIVINLTQNLLIDAFFIKKSVPLSNFTLVKDKEAYNASLSNKDIDCILIQANNSKLIESSGVGLAINICSMQEMNPNIISDYFNFIRNSKNQNTFFYCANRISKKLPDGTTVNFFDYPWHPKDTIIIDELCPWQQKYYNISRPFYCPYDGKHQHRLILCHK